jgi:RNA polymerase sigma-70 factor (ECF subfamily)
MALSPDVSPVGVDGLFARARAGDEEAWAELFQACYPKVIRVVRRRLDRPMRSLFDSTDFASDVMKSLAANAERLDFPSFDSLMAFLAQAAEQKVIDEWRKAHTLKRDIDRQRRFPAGRGDDGECGADAGLASGDPTASQVALATEAHERLLANQSGPEREAIELKQQGYSHAEIARHTGWHMRKVQRFFKDLWDEFGGGHRAR